MKPRIIIIGVNHYDPYGREDVVRKLKDLRDNEGFIPDCIAVEWEEELASMIINERDNYKELIQTCHPLPSDEANILSQTLAYEADSHKSLYPDIPIIWLDAKNPKLEKYKNHPEGYPNIRLFAYESWACTHKIELSNLNSFYTACIKGTDLEEAKQLAESEEEKTRNKSFYEITVNAIESGYKKIVAITGFMHACYGIEDNYIRLLIDNKYDAKFILPDTINDIETYQPIWFPKEFEFL